MEALLPSEIARLVLGYLEEEQCGEAAKCFLNSSPHLGEIRAISQRAKKYSTKINGFNLKDVLEEYCMVHTIVQECISSMSEQPNGTMIECLRSLVRACQPVQVNINIHPHQGQNSATGKLETDDLSTSSSNPRSRKTNSYGQSIEDNDDCIPDQQSVFPQILPDSSSTQSPQTAVRREATHSAQLVPQTPPIAVCESQKLQLHSNMQPASQPDLRIQEHSDLMSHSESSAHLANEISHPNTFHNDNINSFQEPAPPLTPGQLTVASQHQHLVHVSSITQSAVMQVANTEFIPRSEENVSLPSTVPETLQRDFPESEVPVRSYTVTKCFGSNIVILENDDDIPTACLPQGEDAQKSITRYKLPTPVKTNPSEFTESFVRTGVVSKIVENLGEKLGEDLNLSTDALQWVTTQIMDDPCFEQCLQELFEFEESSSDDSPKQLEGAAGGERKKHLRKKKIDSSNTSSHYTDNLVTVPGCTPSKVLPEKSSNSGINFLPDGVTPSKCIIEGDTMTPMTKLLNSITSPSSEHYMDPTQFASLLDIPGSAAKEKEQNLPLISEVPALVQQPPLLAVNQGTYKMVQLPPSINYVYCDSNQQIAQYVNEKGVNTVYTDEVQMPRLQPFVPKILLPRVLPSINCGPSQPQQPPKPKRRPPRAKRCTTRGGRQSTGQVHSSTTEESTEEKNTVTLYAADGKDVSSTISYTASADLPILVSDVSDEVADSNAKESPPAKSAQGERNEESLAQQDSVQQPETTTQQEIVNQKETTAQQEIVHQPETTTQQDKVQQPETIAQQEVLQPVTIAQGQEVVQEPETKAQPEILDVISEEKEASFRNCQSVNSSVVRNTPGRTGSRRPHMKRASLSTPRRRHSHIRALDFNTPTKEGDEHSIRRANTSPKNMSMNALSPTTTGKAVKSSVRESLFKAPGNGSQRTSKAKAHLFKSPEYVMASSSGFSNPTVTSTPAEAGSKCSNLPLPSEAWDKVGGVSLILETDVSPVKRIEPPCKKTLKKSWDSDLRSLAAPPPPPPPSIPSRKRKNNQPAGKKKASKKSKIVQEEEEEANTKADDNSLNNTQDICNESESEMAKVIETNLMNSSFEAVSPVKQIGISGVQTLPSPPKPEKADSTDKIEEDISGSKESNKGSESKADDFSSVAVTDNKSNPSSDSVQVIEKNVVTIDSAKPSGSQEKSIAPANKEQVVMHDSNSDDKIKTPVTDPAVIAVADKNRLSQATWKESFCFDTPVKDDLASIIPQTPRFLDPSFASGEDTPRTKIIKALPFPTVQSAGTPLPSVPPTPTIHSSLTVSPKGLAYFQPETSSPACSSPHPSTKVQSDNLENILIQECSRMEAGGIRQMAKKPVFSKALTNSSEGELEELINTDDSIKSVADETKVTKQNESFKEVVDQQGCARLRYYQRKTNAFNPMVCETFPGLLHTSKNKATTSGDDTDDCLIVSPNRSSSDQKKDNFGCKGSNQVPLPLTNSENAESNTSSGPIVLTSSQTVPNIDGVKIEEALNMLHGSPKKKVTNVTPQKTETISLSLSKETTLSKKSLSTPVKIKLLKTKTPSSKKKPALNISNEQTSDDDSSDSSSSDSSTSESDSNGSSSSSDEDTPVKASVSSVKNTPIKFVDQSDCNEGATIAADMPSSDIHEKSGESSSECPSREVEPRPEEIQDIVESAPIVELERNNCEENVQEQRPEVIESNVESSPTTEAGGHCFKKDEAVTEPTITGKFEEVSSTEKLLKVTADQSRPQESEAQVESPNAFVVESTEANDCRDSPNQPKKDFNNMDLKSLIDTGDMGSCKKLAKSRNSLLTSKTSVMSELREKRLRTIAQLKGPPGGKDSKRKVSTGNSSKPESLYSDTHIDTKMVQEDSAKPLTKDKAICKELPKKRRSKSETDGVERHEESKDNTAKRRSASDSAKGSSDDEEFKLHLSGDEKEETEHESVVAEALMTTSPTDVIKINQPSVVAPKTIGTPDPVISCESSPKLVAPEASKQNANYVSRNVSSKAADNVIKALLEKGFNCPLPSLPSEKIKKIAPTAKRENSEKKSVKSSDSRAHNSSPNPTSSKCMSLKQNEITTNIDECADDLNEEATETVNNTSITSCTREVIIRYSGLGPIKPKRDVFSISAVRLDMGENTSVSLSPSNFITLYNAKPKDKGSEAESERRRQRSDSNRTDSKVCNTTPRHMYGRDSRDIRARGQRDSGSGDRGTRHREDDRSRRNQSPHRHRGTRDYSNDRSRFRDPHWSQDRSKRNSSRREEASSSSRKHSENRATESFKSNTKKLSMDPEDGEILSSDSELDSRTRRKKIRPSSQENKQSARERRTVKESVSRRRESNQSSSLKENITVRKPFRHRINLIPTSKEDRPLSTIGMKPSTSEKLHHPLESEDTNDLDLDDDENFPVLGDDELDEGDSKETDQNSSKESNTSVGVVLRRAPPRSVNAHKVTVPDTQTPSQRVKRKLSISPDLVSEDSQSSLSSVNPDGKQMQVLRQSKKRMSTTTGKVSKPNENEDVAHCSEIIKNLNVDAFLSKIHG